jgi:hypothetical protein
VNQIEFMGSLKDRLDALFDGEAELLMYFIEMLFYSLCWQYK